MPVHIDEEHSVADTSSMTLATADWSTNSTTHPVNSGVTMPFSERQRDEHVMPRLILVAVDME